MTPSGRNSKKKKRQRAKTMLPSNFPISSYNDDPWLPIIKRRRRFTLEEANVLEEEYMKNSNPPQETIKSLAESMSASRKIITTWFQNRRAKNKRRAREEEQDYNSDTNSTVTTTSAAVTEATLMLQQQEQNGQESEQHEQHEQQIDQLSLQQLVIEHSQYYNYYPVPLPQQHCNYTEEKNLLSHQQSYAHKDQDNVLLQQQQAYQNFIMNASSSEIVSTNHRYNIHSYRLPTSSACTPPLYVNPAELQLDYKPDDKAAPIISTDQQPSLSSSSSK
jgi:hypothetical protein